MSLVVKQWTPAKECKECKQAKKIMDEHTRISMHTIGIAVKKIREQENQIKELKSFIVEIYPLIHAYGNEQIADKAIELMPEINLVI